MWSGRPQLFILGLLAVIATLGVEVYRRAELRRWNADRAEFRANTELVIAALRTELLHPESCSHVLAGLPFATNGPTPVMLNYGYDRPGPLVRNAELAEGILINNMSLEFDGAARADMRTEIADYPEQKLERWASRLRIELKPREAKTPYSLVYEFPLRVWTDGHGKILSCFGRASAANLCNSFGGYYLVDYAEPPEGSERCKLSAHSEVLVGDEYVSRGACRYAGLTKSVAECGERAGDGATAYPLQNARLEAGPANSYQCLACE